MAMTPIEKLAREICWAGFTHPEARRGKRKASYWKSITEGARVGYIADARQFAHLLDSLDIDTINALNLKSGRVVAHWMDLDGG